MAAKTFPTFHPGDAIMLFGRVAATVLSVHRGGKTIGVVTEFGKKTFVKSENAKLATA